MNVPNAELKGEREATSIKQLLYIFFPITLKIVIFIITYKVSTIISIKYKLRIREKKELARYHGIMQLLNKRWNSSDSNTTQHSTGRSRARGVGGDSLSRSETCLLKSTCPLHLCLLTLNFSSLHVSSAASAPHHN